MNKSNARPGKMFKKKEQYLDANINKNKNRYSIYYAANNKNSQQFDAYKSLNRKSIEINTSTQPVRALNTISQISRPVYRRISYHQKQPKRYEQQDSTLISQIKNRASPYTKKQQYNQIGGRTSILNRSSGSNTKIRSGNLTKQLSPYQLYKQPRSSLSQHYDPTLQTSLHKRRQSHVQQKSQALKVAKQFYKQNNFDKCCDYLRRYLKTNPTNDNIEAQYLFGMSLINKSQLRQGIDALLKVLQQNPSYKKTLYLILALAYKRQSQYQQAIHILSKGLQLYPQYYDLIVYRGKMYLKQEKYQNARKDFINAIQQNKHKGFAYLGKGTCQIYLKYIDDAIKTFTQGIQTDLAHVCYQKRGICFYEQQKYQKSISDLQQASLYDNYSSSSLQYYKGMIYYRKNNPTQALLSFQQCLKCDNNKQLVTLAIQMMLRIKIQDKDFYQAYHIINRTQNIQVDKEVIDQWKLFLQASLFLMKKKYKEGLDAYDSLERKELYQKSYQSISSLSQKERYKFLKPLIHLYKAFGYLSENKAEKAQLQYQYHTAICKSIGITSQNLSKRYNTLIAQANKKFPDDATQLLIQARDLIPTKPQPYLFISFDIMHRILKQNSDYQRQQGLNQIMQNLSIGIGHLPQLSNNHISSFYYFRSIVQLYRQEFNKSVSDIDKAIEKSQDNIAKYFYLRGLIFACFGNFTQSIQDLSVAINLDEKYAKPYLQRAKCLQIEGNSNQAFIDLQKYITLAPQDPYIHKYAGFLLFQNCAYQDCLSAFSHGSQLPNDQQLILTKAKCNFLLGQYDIALQHFTSYQQHSNSNLFSTDIQIIKICNSIPSLSQTNTLKLHQFIEQIDYIITEFKQQDSKIFKLRDLYQLKGSIQLILGNYDSSLIEFNKTLDLFRVEKQKQFQKNLIQDPNEFQQEWSEIEIKFNISLCHLCKQEYDIAYQMLSQYAQSTQKGKNWDLYIQLIQQLLDPQQNPSLLTKQKILDTFQQNHRISKLWPKITLPESKIKLSLAFSYPFVQPPQMMPQFDTSLFNEFDMRKVQPKPQAPWINRNQNGLVFTPNIQVYDNLQLSMTTKKNQDQQQNQHNKPSSQIDHSISMSNSQFHLETQDLKRKFKLDSLVEMKLNKMLNK